MGVFKQVWEVYKENGCELTLHRSIATHVGRGAVSDADAAAINAFVAELERFLSDAETFLLMLSVGLRGLFDTQSSFIGLLLREDVLQASVIDFLLEKLSEFATDVDTGRVLERTLPTLILREIRWIDHVVDSKELVEKLISALPAFSIALQRDVIYILPEIAGDADAHHIIDAMLELIRNEADLVVCCIEALGNFNVVNEQTSDVIACVLERLDSSPLVDLPVIVKYLVQEAPGTDIDLIAGELREKLSATLSFTEPAVETTSSKSGRLNSIGPSTTGVDPTRNEEALVLGAIIQGFYFREDLLKAFLASMAKTASGKATSNLCLLDIWVLFGAHSIPRDRQKIEKLFKIKVVNGAISRALLVKSIKGHANALKTYFGSTLQLASFLISQQNNGVCTVMGSLMFEVLFEEFSLCCKDGKNEAAYYQGEIVNSLLGFCLSATNETTDAAFKTLRALVSPQVTFASELRDSRYEMSHFKRRHRFNSSLPTLKQLLDTMEIISTDQARHAYEILFAVGGPEDAELLNTIRKQMSHQETRYRKYGILGAVAQMNRLLLQHVEDAATRVNRDSSSPDDRKAAEAFTKAVKGLLRVTISQGGCVDFLLREIRRWVQHLGLDRHSSILIDIVSNHAMELLENRFMDIYDGRAVQAGEYRKTVLDGTLKADTWMSLDDQASTLYLKVLDLATSPNVRDQESLHYMSPLVELVLECGRKTGKLNFVDCILVCPIQMMERSVIEDISGLNELAQNAVCSTVWHTINWFRAIINFYADSTRTYHREKVFERVKNLLQMESILLDELLDVCPQFGPPRMQHTTSVRRSTGKVPDAVKKKPRWPTKNAPHADRRILIQSSFDPLRADVLKILASTELWHAISEQSITSQSNPIDSTRPHVLVETLVSAFETFAMSEHHTGKRASQDPIFCKIFSESLGWHEAEISKETSACTAQDVLASMCKYAHHFAKVLQKNAEEDDETETDVAMENSAKQIVRAYLQIGAILFETLISATPTSPAISPVILCQDYFLPKDHHVQVRLDADDDVRSQVVESCFQAAIKFSSVVSDDIQLATSLLRALLSIASVTYGFPAHQIANRATRLQLKRARKDCSGKDMSVKISAMALSYLQQDWSGGDKRFVCKSIDLVIFLGCYLVHGDVILDNVQELAIDGILALTENGGKDVETFPTLTKKTLATYHRAMFDALVVATIRLDFAASLSEDCAVLLLNYLTQAVLLFRILVGITKSFQKPTIVATVLKQGRKFVEIIVTAMPFFKSQFLDHNEQILKIIAEVQVATRRMQVLCAHGKLIRDGSAATQVPMVKRILERFIYKGEELAREHGLLDAFSTGVLKNKRIDGTTITKEDLEAMEAERSDSDTDSDRESEPEAQEDESSTEDEAANREPNDDDDDEQPPPSKVLRKHK